MSDNTISLIIPLYNEEKRLENTLNTLKVFKHKNESIEIIFVNDGSTDGTLEILNKKIFKYKIVSYAQNHGKGYAIKRGIELAKGDIIFFMDGDLSIPLKYIPLFKQHILKGNDVVIGNKRKKNYKNILRKIASISFNLLLKIFLNLRFNDTQCGFKAFKKNVGKKLFAELNEYGFTFDVEILLRAKKEGFRIKEIEVEWFEDVKNSSVRIWKDSIKMFFKILTIRKNVK